MLYCYIIKLNILLLVPVLKTKNNLLYGELYCRYTWPNPFIMFVICPSVTLQVKHLAAIFYLPTFSRYFDHLSQLLWNIVYHCSMIVERILITQIYCLVLMLLPVVELELSTLPEHPSSPTFLCGVHATQSWVFCVVFGRSTCLSLSPVSFGYCSVRPSMIDGFWLQYAPLVSFLHNRIHKID